MLLVLPGIIIIIIIIIIAIVIITGIFRKKSLSIAYTVAVHLLASAVMSSKENKNLSCHKETVRLLHRTVLTKFNWETIYFRHYRSIFILQPP